MYSPTDVIQAIAAIGTLGLTVMVYLQSRKVKTLTEVVEGLDGQTKELSNQTNELQRQAQYARDMYSLSLYEFTQKNGPRLECNHLNNDPNGKYLAIVNNDGVLVFKVTALQNKGIQIECTSLNQYKP